jgi:predicted ATPase
MLLTIKNIGLIDYASIRLDGLTIIGGENDMGKSTAGKLMFAITKALSRYNDDFALSKETNIINLAESIFLNLRRVSLKNIEIYREEFHPKKFVDALNYFGNFRQKLLFDSLEINEYDVNLFFSKKISLIVNDKEIKSENLKKKIIESIEKIKNEILEEENRETLIQKALNRALVSEFYFEISPNDKPSKITITDNDILLIDIEIKKNEIQKVKVGDLFNFEDVTFIETPIILQLSELINYSNTLFEVISEDRNVRLGSLNRPSVPLHVKDLMNKLQKSSRIESLFHNSTVDFWKSVSNTIDGTFQYDKQTRDFIFKRKDKKETSEFKSLNTASGIKSFGIIQLLLQAGFIDERTLLIIDEPETHLHPKWQVEYAKLLIELVKNDFNILLTSHSPYMIQALRVLSEKEEVNERTAFYLAEKNSKNRVEFEDVSKDIKKLFKKLAEPLNQLLWQ